ncbi:STAS domain-containing protein [Actinocorallia populi]|uniref:STAS domain-containing protein n=1 Tax=Actinocorallia populi TaxID=2079200 RepID=UPI0013003147|nr:STAS domain-containing protein [Actinocorallia populi]
MSETAMTTPSAMDAVLTITPLTEQPGLRLIGEIDLYTIDRATSALADAIRSDAPEIYLDLAGVDYCGIEGLRLFALTAQRLGRQGRELVLCSLSPHLAKVLRLLGWDTIPGLLSVPRRPSAGTPAPAHTNPARPFAVLAFPDRTPWPLTA